MIIYTCKEDFNTSHVNVNRSCAASLTALSLISIHLMLMLILAQSCLQPPAEIISIHLMLMLILSCSSVLFPSSHFNTSHVNVNPATTGAKWKECRISIHLMLMLIPLCRGSVRAAPAISIHLMLMLICNHFHIHC